MRLKELFELRNGYTPSKAVAEFWDGGTIPWFRMEDIRTNGRILSDSIQHITPEAVKTAGLFDANSFIMATTATIGEHAWLIADSLANQRFTNLKVRKSLIKRVALKYIFYLLFPIGESCKKNCRITTFPAVDMNEFKNYSFSLPPLAEQEAIAEYLDKECEKIGREIELLERKADGYRRLRRSLINRAVTRGLNPNTTLKPSGLRWIPLVPEHWNIGRVRNFFNFRNEKVSEQDFAPLSVTKNGVVPQMENVAKSMAEGDSRKKVCKDDFVVNSRSDRKGSCGTAPLDGSVSLIYIVLEPTDIDPQFADYYFRCNDWVEEFYRNGKGIVADLWTTNYSAMRNIEIAIPDIEEQKEIATYLEEKCGKIDAIVEKIETKIERLKQLKRSLINEVVTGQRAINTSLL